MERPDEQALRCSLSPAPMHERCLPADVVWRPDQCGSGRTNASWGSRLFGTSSHGMRGCMQAYSPARMHPSVCWACPPDPA